MEQIPLSYEASDGYTNKQTTTSLPTEVVQCLQNARFLHLATCVDNQPHVSLMNYTYLPGAPAAPAHPTTEPRIVMTTSMASKKTHNILANANVSLLVHDWVSHRPLTRRMSAGSALSEEAGPETAGAAPAAEHPPSSLAALLLNLNTAAMSSISATINGTARLLPEGSAEEAYYRQQHLAHNTFDADPVGPQEGRIHQQLLRGRASGGHSSSSSAGAGTGTGTGDGSERFVAGEAVRVIVVSIRDVRISDWEGRVRDWVLQPADAAADAAAEQPAINGVPA